MRMRMHILKYTHICVYINVHKYMPKIAQICVCVCMCVIPVCMYVLYCTVPYCTVAYRTVLYRTVCLCMFM